MELTVVGRTVKQNSDRRELRLDQTRVGASPARASDQ
jgi:hypothetical protein